MTNKKKPPSKPKPARQPEKQAPSPQLQKALDELQKANEFLESSGGRQLQNLEDPKIYILDQYIKQVLDILVTTASHGLRQLVAVCNGSPLIALHKMCQQKILEQPDDLLTKLVMERLEEDIRLRHTHQTTNGYTKVRSAALLRQRGLMK